ncbi:MAG TPA: hypothetical protein GX528_02720 [Firmicutes bacterium]|nr:hypothetical protein [Bacillota bacterium]
MKDYLEFPQLRVAGPREIIKQAIKMGLIEDGHIRIDALTDRTRTVHTDDEAPAQKWQKISQKSIFPF